MASVKKTEFLPLISTKCSQKKQKKKNINQSSVFLLLHNGNKPIWNDDMKTPFFMNKKASRKKLSPISTKPRNPHKKSKETQELEAVAACAQAALRPHGFLPQISKRPFLKSAQPTAATQERVMTMTEAFITYARSSLGGK